MSSLRELSTIVEELSTLCSFNAFKLVNDLLIKVNNRLKITQPDKVLTYIRTTSAARNELPAWKKLVDNAYTEFKSRETELKIDADRLFYGLR